LTLCRNYDNKLTDKPKFSQIFFGWLKSGLSDALNFLNVTTANMSGRERVEKTRERWRADQTVLVCTSFQVGCICHLLHKSIYSEQVGAGAPVCLAAVRKYLAE